MSGTWRGIVADFGGRSHWLDLDGPLHYAEFGAGFGPGPRAATSPDEAANPDAVLLHGLGGSFVDWLALAPLLATGRRVLVLDMPGHGLSPAAGRTPRLADLQSLLYRFVTATEAHRPLLIGNSLGGAVVALEAAAHPGSTSGVVLLDPVLPISARVRPHPLVVAGFAAYAVPWLGRRVLGRRRALVDPEVLIRQSLAFCCAAPDQVPEPVVTSAVRLAEYRRARPPDDGAFLAVARDILRSLAHPNAYRAMLDSIEVPVLLLHGTEDRFVPQEAARRVARRQPLWKNVFLDGVGHLPQLESADRVAAIISSWQQALPSPQPPRPDVEQPRPAGPGRRATP